MHCRKCGAKLLQLFDVAKLFPHFLLPRGTFSAELHHKTQLGPQLMLQP